MDAHMIILGIDPGLSGALCFDDGEARHIVDIPTFSLARNGKNKREVDAIKLASAWHEHRPRIGHAFVEQVGAMPGQGVSSVFAFGKSYGILIGILAANGVPVTFVAPKVWKKQLGVPSSKDGARARASELMPETAGEWRLAKHDGRAEAALIAYWGRQTLVSISSGVPLNPHRLPPADRAAKALAETAT